MICVSYKDLYTNWRRYSPQGWSVLTNRVAGTHRYFRISYKDLYKNMQMRRKNDSRDEYRPCSRYSCRCAFGTRICTQIGDGTHPKGGRYSPTGWRVLIGTSAFHTRIYIKICKGGEKSTVEMSTAHDRGTHLDVRLVQGFVHKLATVLTPRVVGTHQQGGGYSSVLPHFIQGFI